MIQSNELRKGNLVFCNGHICKVGGMSYSDFDADFDSEWLGLINIGSEQEADYYSKDLEFYTSGSFAEGIQLTADWLIRFGLHLKHEPISRLEIDSDFGEARITLKSLNCDGDAIYGVMKLCRYVHQLQNLYFALTGMELEMKNEVGSITF